MIFCASIVSGVLRLEPLLLVSIFFLFRRFLSRNSFLYCVWDAFSFNLQSKMRKRLLYQLQTRLFANFCQILTLKRQIFLFISHSPIAKASPSASALLISFSKSLDSRLTVLLHRKFQQSIRNYIVAYAHNPPKGFQ